MTLWCYCDVISYHIISYHIISYHIISYHIHIISYITCLYLFWYVWNEKTHMIQRNIWMVQFWKPQVVVITPLGSVLQEKKGLVRRVKTYVAAGPQTFLLSKLWTWNHFCFVLFTWPFYRYALPRRSDVALRSVSQLQPGCVSTSDWIRWKFVPKE